MANVLKLWHAANNHIVLTRDKVGILHGNDGTDPKRPPEDDINLTIHLNLLEIHLTLRSHLIL